MLFPSLQQVQHRSAKLLPALLCLLRLGDVPRSKVRTRFGTCGREEGHADTRIHVHTRANLAQDGVGRLARTSLPQPPFHRIQGDVGFWVEQEKGQLTRFSPRLAGAMEKIRD